jgi:hypothetical protein
VIGAGLLPIVALAALVAGGSTPVPDAADATSRPASTGAVASGPDGSRARGDVPAPDGLVYLVPDMAEETWTIAPGPKRFARKLAFSPGYGRLGDNELYTFRFAYSPNEWLGWEAAVAHNPGQSVHALLHTFSAVLRYPLPWRVQPYATAGYGMFMVFPGESINADPVTDNALVIGGGLELYIREDLAIRAELRQATVFGGVRGSNETVTYGYREATIGFAFHRSLGGDDASGQRP